MKNLLTSFLFTLATTGFAAPGDTLGVSPGSTPTFAPNNQLTLLPYSGGYAFGVNGDNVNNLIKIAQGYVNDESVLVGGVLAFVAKKGKGIENVPNTKIVFGVHDISPTGCIDLVNVGSMAPGPNATALATKSLFFEEIDTTFTAYTGVEFDTPVAVNGNLAVSIDFSELRAAGDTFAVYTDNIGDANGLNYAFHCAAIGGDEIWVISNQLFQGAINNNVAIFPVLYEDDASIGKAIQFQGISTRIQPNPAADLLLVTLNGKADTYTVKLCSMNGTEIQSKSIQTSENTDQMLQFEVSELASGNYLLLLTGSKGSRIARQVVISH